MYVHMQVGQDSPQVSPGNFHGKQPSAGSSGKSPAGDHLKFACSTHSLRLLNNRSMLLACSKLACGDLDATDARWRPHQPKSDFQALPRQLKKPSQAALVIWVSVARACS